MLNLANLRRPTFIAACGLTLATLLHTGAGYAKVSAAQGADGAPPDPQTEAAVDALNDALADGPDPGQSWESWEAEIAALLDVLSGTTTTTASSTPAVVDSGDMCESPVSLWMSTDSTATVANAMAEPSVRQELTQNLEEYLYGQLYLRLYGIAGLSFDAPDVTSFSCSRCTMTYVECLAQNLGVDWCKHHALNCPTQPRSAVTVRIPITSPASGEVTLHATVSYRELDDPSSSLPYQYCVDVGSFDTTGFGVLDAYVRGKIENEVDVVLCEPAWNWSYGED